MRFDINGQSKQEVKMAHHIKIPYASERLDIANTEYNAYNKIYNTLYHSINDKYATYFFIRNNYVYYHRETSNTSPIFRLDVLRGAHQVFDTSHLIHRFKETDNIVVGTKDGKRYIITNNVDWGELRKCVAVIDATSGNNLYIESKENKLYLEVFPPIANSVVPIVQVTKDQINIHMIDLTTERLDTISWGLSNLKELISTIINLSRSHGKTKEIILGDNLTKISRFTYETPDYIYRYDNQGNVYLKAIRINFSLSVSGTVGSYNFTDIQLRIDLDGNRIMCSWNTKSGDAPQPAYLIATIEDASAATATNKKSSYILDGQKINHEITKLFARNYPHVVAIKDNYLSNVLYSNTCGCLFSSSHGLGITTSKSRMVHYHKENVIHKYKDYLIIVSNLFTNQDRKIKRLLIIDTKNALMGIWEINKTEWACESESVMYNTHYLDDYKKLIFISATHESTCMFYIDIDKILSIFRSIHKSECEIRKYEHVKDAVKSYDIKQLIIKAIINYHRKNPRNDSVQIIGHYVDENASKIYVVAKYILSEGKSIPESEIRIYTALFIGTISKWDITFKFYYYIVGALNPSYKFQSLSTRNILKSKNNKVQDLLKIDLYNSNYLYRHEFKHNKAKDLDLSYDDNRFFSLRYHRRSYRIIKEKQYIMSTSISAIDSLFLLEYKYSGSKGIKHNNFIVIVKDLLLVGKMKKINFLYS
jgi:hypothetical protein